MLMSLSWPSSRAHKLLLCFICLCCHFDSRKYACVRSQATFFSAWVSCEDSRLSCFPLLEKKKTQKNLWDQGRLKVSENQKTVIFTSEFLFCKLSACFSQDVFQHLFLSHQWLRYSWATRDTGCVIRKTLVTPSSRGLCILWLQRYGSSFDLSRLQLVSCFVIESVEVAAMASHPTERTVHGLGSFVSPLRQISLSLVA